MFHLLTSLGQTHCSGIEFSLASSRHRHILPVHWLQGQDPIRNKDFCKSCTPQVVKLHLAESMRAGWRPEVVAARQAMLDRCLVSVLAAPPPLCDAPPLLAFLAPAESHWEGAGPEASLPGGRGPAGAGGCCPRADAAAAQPARQRGRLLRILCRRVQASALLPLLPSS